MESNASQFGSPTKNVSVTVLILAVLLTASSTAAIVLAVVHFGQPARVQEPAATVKHAEAMQHTEDPFSQRGTIHPEGELTGIVYYPIPYATPPHLNLSPGRRYSIARQDEFSFVWVDRERTNLPSVAADILKDLPGLADALTKKAAEAQSKEAIAPADSEQPELTWEAKGMRVTAEARPLRLFQQTGTFYNLNGSEGEVKFPFPYASPPNVELAGKVQTTLISEITATGFRWKNGGTAMWDQGDATWTAKGIRATEVPK
jgi:hypothetical protein